MYFDIKFQSENVPGTPLSCPRQKKTLYICKTKAQISCEVSTQLISPFVFATDSMITLLPKYNI